MVMARPLYSLLTNVPFCLHIHPGAAVIYVRAVVTAEPVNKCPIDEDGTVVDQHLIQSPQALLSLDAEYRVCVFYGP